MKVFDDLPALLRKYTLSLSLCLWVKVDLVLFLLNLVEFDYSNIVPQFLVSLII
jgi:hypothetical protein